MSLPKNPLPLSNGLDANGRLAANNLSADYHVVLPLSLF